MKLKELILNFLFPKFCVGCQKEGSFLCPSCYQKIIQIKIPTCPFCNKITPQGQLCPSCRKKHQLSGVLISAYFESPLKEAIYAFKYEKIKEFSFILSLLLKERLKLFPKKNFLITFIPLHWKRKNERGFNQSELLAENLALIFEKSFKKLLVRKKETLPQIELKKKERQENIKEAFLFIGDQSIKGKRVLIVDDVFTTGATLNECAKELRSAGAREVWGVVLAKQK